MTDHRAAVVVADDAPLIREGISQLLSGAGCEVLAAVSDAEELAQFMDKHPGAADVIVLDIRMPPTHTDEGIRALESLRAQGDEVGVLLLSMYASPTLAMRALAAGGATGYLLTDRVRDGTTLADAVRTIAAGGSVVDPEVVSLLMASRRRAKSVDRLSARETEVLTLMAEGRSNLGISRSLGISAKTVDSHVEHILDKLGIQPSADEHRRVLAVLELLRFQE
jgi:DNA-binding NarL/FixJ family response regulator